MSSGANRLGTIGKHISPSSRNELKEVIGSDTGASIPPLTTHVLDTGSGKPATAVEMILSIRNEINNSWEVVERRSTNSDGRGSFLNDAMWKKAVYKLYFNTDKYFQENGQNGFYPYVEVVFRVDEPSKHYHVPLLLSQFGYTTYRGS